MAETLVVVRDAQNIHLLKLMELDTLNVCILLYVNYTSKKWNFEK